MGAGLEPADDQRLAFREAEKASAALLLTSACPRQQKFHSKTHMTARPRNYSAHWQETGQSIQVLRKPEDVVYQPHETSFAASGKPDVDWQRYGGSEEFAESAIRAFEPGVILFCRDEAGFQRLCIREE